MERLDLQPWLFSNAVRINQHQPISHSHPIITLNTWNVDDPEMFLALFIHEQIHWHLSAHPQKERLAMQALKAKHPEVPVGKPSGARSEYSSYMHLLACWLEFDAMRHLLGDESARRLMARKPYYRWIYGTVLDDDEWLGDLIKRHGLMIEVKL